MSKQYIIKQDDMRQMKLDAWHKGINPYPRLTMDESHRLLILMSNWHTGDFDECAALQRKACGIEEQPRCSWCKDTGNLAECRATHINTYLLCGHCLADERREA